MDRKAAEEILTGLKAEGLFQSYAFCRNGDGLCLLGQSKSSYVYEVYARKYPEKRYALKIIGLKGITLPAENFHQMVLLHKQASESSEYVTKILACEEIVLMSKQGELRLQCILMEKLEPLITVISFGQATYFRKELESFQEKLTLINHIATAVMVLHRENILHRDIKLENIFYDREENCYKLGDFSVSVYTETGSADDIVYTDGYGAPEIESKTGGSYDDTADIYSLGIVLYLLLNRLRFPGADGYYVNPVQYQEGFVFPACENGSTEWTELIRKMCRYQKEQRFQSMEEVMGEINRLTVTSTLPEKMKMKGPFPGSTILYRESTEDAGKQDDRYEKKGILRGLLFYYESRSKWYGIALTGLTALLLGTLQPDLPRICDMGWRLQLMLCLVVIEMILLHFGELHLLFGAGAVLAGIIFMQGEEQYILYTVLLLGIWYGIPLLGTAGVAGVLLCNLLKYMGWEGYQSLLIKYHLEWILVTLILLLVNRIIMLRRECVISSPLKEFWEQLWCYMIPVVFLLTGILVSRTEIVRNPELLRIMECVRPGRTGCIVLAVNLIDFVIHRKQLRLGEYLWNEYLG